MNSQITFGLPRMHKERGEVRDFLPFFVEVLHRHGAQIVAEHGYGSGMGLEEADYLRLSPTVRFTSHEECYQQNIVLVLRCPEEDELRLIRHGACLISMLHYPTRPQRTSHLKAIGIEAISLDSIHDDSGRRLVENLRAVGWNGVQIAMQTLRNLYPPPGFESPDRSPIYVTLLGAGAVGSHVVQAAIRYGNNDLRRKLADAGVPGVLVNVVDYDLTSKAEVMRPILKHTDILVDATQRLDTSKPVIPNDWLADLPAHAILLDLSVDPYGDSPQEHQVKGIEGIPQGNLDQYVFAPDDPIYETLPVWVNTAQRRYVVSSYSWPGIYPKECMTIYGRQLQPLMRILLERGGPADIRPKGRFFERALSRAMLSNWSVSSNKE